jgi:DNA-binding response OmpR family regulator
MKTQYFSEMHGPDSSTGAELPARNSCSACSSALEGSTILLISTDTRLYQTLRSLANTVGRMIVRLECPASALPILQAVRPGAVLLDLDLPEDAAWETAEALLHDQTCPPVILLTARSEQFDMRTAIRAGSIIAKSESPSRLLEIVDETLTMQGSAHAERNAIQRILIRWLKPCSWSAPVTPAHRFWGINE